MDICYTLQPIVTGTFDIGIQLDDVGNIEKVTNREVIDKCLNCYHHNCELCRSNKMVIQNPNAKVPVIKREITEQEKQRNREKSKRWYWKNKRKQLSDSVA